MWRKKPSNEPWARLFLDHPHGSPRPGALYWSPVRQGLVLARRGLAGPVRNVPGSNVLGVLLQCDSSECKTRCRSCTLDSLRQIQFPKATENLCHSDVLNMVQVRPRVVSEPGSHKLDCPNPACVSWPFARLGVRKKRFSPVRIFQV